MAAVLPRIGRLVHSARRGHAGERFPQEVQALPPPTVCRHVVGGRPVRSLVLGDARRSVPQVVVVPGLGALGYLMPMVSACAQWTQVHLLDLPGFGDRRTARLPAGLGDVARAVSGWLAQAPAAPVLLLGHSTGAQAALRAADARPDSVARLVLAGLTFPPQARRLLPVAGRVLRTLPYERPGELPAVLPEYLRGAPRLPSLIRTALTDRPEELAPRVRSPLLVVRGRHDHLCPQQWAGAIAAAAPDGRVQVVPGGHNTPYTHPDVMAAVVRREVL